MSTLETQKTGLEVKIRQKAQAAYDAALKKAALDAEHLIEKARDAAEADTERAVSAAEAQAEAYARENKANAELEAKLYLLKAKDGYVAKVFSQMWEKLEILSQRPEYLQVVRALIEEGAAQIKADTIRVTAGAVEKKLLTGPVLEEVRDELKKKLKREVALVIAPETVSAPGGIILSNEAGTLEYDNSWRARFARLKEEMYIKVSEIIFK